jgi:two-component system OmpR family sensor kinase
LQDFTIAGRHFCNEILQSPSAILPSCKPAIRALPMKWHNSLYWRIAIGFVLFLALLLVVQATLFIWVVARTGTISNQPPDRFAQTVAFDVGAALERDATLDIERYIRDEYAGDSQPFFVLLSDNRVFEFDGPFQAEIISDSRTRLQLMLARGPQRGPGDRGGFGAGFGGGFGRGDRPGMPPGSPSSRLERARTGLRPFRPAPIIAGERLAGIVVVPPQPPFRFLLVRYAPTLGAVAVVTLVVGALLASIVIFGPARRRLRAVEDAARRLGAGDLTARAPSGGRDEVAAVATAFNAMATDLAGRADALAASDRARRQLLADVSHELTTPVTAMRGYLETLMMPDFPLDDVTRGRYLGIIGDETSRLERTIGDLLELARLEGGGGSVSFDAVPVDQLFGRVVARHERVAAAAGVSMATVIEPGADRVHGDGGRLEQALQNLAANALRYAPAGSTIELRARRIAGTGREGSPDGIALTVRDEGPGIIAEHLPRLFDRFYKAESSRAARVGASAGHTGSATAAGGSGLGLSIVKAIVERHGGRVSVRSRPGETVFEIVLPDRKH